ncbi:MAG: STAS/SEC14 domain-containing protein [Chloroflexi bacterium]|nr:STAS/SEC14 domain-containing protein [Chloroflexota bacterium]
MAHSRIAPKTDALLDEVLHEISDLDTPHLEEFLPEVSLLLAQRKAARLSKRESELLIKINQGLPVEMQERYDELMDKLRNGDISASEHQELLRLVDQIEQADAERLQYLIELARLRNISVDELMAQLGIHPPAVYA